MKTTSMIVITASLLLSSAAYAAGDCIGCTYQLPTPEAGYGTERIENVPVKQNPFDVGRMNESPIRGKGRISVVHNEPAAGNRAAYTNEEVNAALRFLGRPELGTSRVLSDDNGKVK